MSRVSPIGSASATRSARRLALRLSIAALLVGMLGLAAGSDGWSLNWRVDGDLIEAIRAPRTAGAFLVGALLGLAGAIAQGLFRNPLADPYLLGSASGAGLGVTLVLAAGEIFDHATRSAAVEWLLRLGLVGAAFAGALGGVLLTVTLARGAARPLVLLLCGVVVGVMAGALADLAVLLSPAAMRGRQAFLLGNTGLLGWSSVWVLLGAGAVALPLARRSARALDALVLGESTAWSLGVNVPRQRLLLVALMALATGTAVAQAGLIAFVGLVAPHLVRRCTVATHAALLPLAALAGGVLLLVADVLARSLIAPQEVPVGVVTALSGGLYLLALLHADGRRSR